MRKLVLLLLALASSPAYPQALKAPGPALAGPHGSMFAGAGVAPWQFGPLFTPVASRSSHVIWRNGAINDLLGVSWVTPTFAVPQVAASGRIPPGAGPIGSSTYYATATNSDAYDFAGDFYICAAWYMRTTLFSEVILSTHQGTPTSGYELRINASTGTWRLLAYTSPTATSVATVNAAVAGLNVGCIGHSGTTVSAKLNLGAIATTSQGANTWTANTANATWLGLMQNYTFAFADGYLIEILAVGASPGADSTAWDATYTAAMNQVKQKVGGTSW